MAYNKNYSNNPLTGGAATQFGRGLGNATGELVRQNPDLGKDTIDKTVCGTLIAGITTFGIAAIMKVFGK